MMYYADHHGFPIITFIDTPGAFADLKSEEIGQVCFAFAILFYFLKLIKKKNQVPWAVTYYQPQLLSIGLIGILFIQGEAIAHNLRSMFGLKVPIVTVVIGEGGSGGALAIGCANKLLMMENAVFFVAR